MNENSSRYVDDIAINKLVNQKLSLVKHSPYKSRFTLEEHPFADFFEIARTLPEAEITEVNGAHRWSFKSTIETPYEENNKVTVIHFPAPAPRGNLVFVHGLYEDNILMYHFLISMLTGENLNVFFMQLPYHHDRKPRASAFSGEYFWSADIPRNQSALKQSIFDLYQTYRLVENMTRLPTTVTTFSMGGCVALKLGAMYPGIKGIFLINSVSTLTKLTWQSPLLSTIKAELIAYNYDFDKVEAIMGPFEPFSESPCVLSGEKTVLAYGLYDQIIMKQDYQFLIERLKPRQVYEYSSGHLNILRVPKLAKDIGGAFQYFTDT